MQNAYDLDAEYTIGLLDVPHKIVISPIIELPFGEGKRWAQSGVGAAHPRRLDDLVDHRLRERLPVLGRRTTPTPLSAYGFPVQRPNLDRRSELETTGNREERLVCAARQHDTWIDPAAFAHPGLALGTPPRTLTDVRTPHRNNWDFVASKDVRMGGSRRAQIRLEVLNITNTVKAADRRRQPQFGNADLRPRRRPSAASCA